MYSEQLVHGSVPGIPYRKAYEYIILKIRRAIFPKLAIIFLHVVPGERRGVGSRPGFEVDQVLASDPAKMQMSQKGIKMMRAVMIRRALWVGTSPGSLTFFTVKELL